MINTKGYISFYTLLLAITGVCILGTGLWFALSRQGEDVVVPDDTVNLETATTTNSIVTNPDTETPATGVVDELKDCAQIDIVQQRLCRVAEFFATRPILSTLLVPNGNIEEVGKGEVQRLVNISVLQFDDSQNMTDFLENRDTSLVQRRSSGKIVEFSSASAAQAHYAKLQTVNADRGEFTEVEVGGVVLLRQKLLVDTRVNLIFIVDRYLFGFDFIYVDNLQDYYSVVVEVKSALEEYL